MELAFIISIVELVAKHGVPATIAVIKAFDKDEITLEDIQALKDRVPPPESYFEE